MLPRPILLLVLLLTLPALNAQTASGSPFTSSVWSGNLTPTSVSVVTRLTSANQRVRLQISQNAALTAPLYSSAVTTAESSGNTVTLSVTSLQPDTDYYYGIEVAGVLRTEPESRGRFRTFPMGRSSFKIAFASCGDFRHPNQTAFDAILAERPLLFIHMGDLHYSDINSTEVGDYRNNYDSVLNQPNEAALFRGVPLAYMWDDHDFCGDNANGTAIGRDAARTAYRERTPHYPIATGAGGTMAQSFTIGRVRVIMTDLRSASSDPALAESASKSRMGATQKAWFKQELISARDAGFPLILWVCTDPWIGAAQVGADTWAGHATERVEIANFIRDNKISNIAILAGDMHGLAYDDGTHSDYATGGGAPMTVLHAAALSSEPNSKGGPYTAGPFPGSQQYGILEITDNGGPTLQARFHGKRVGEGVKLTYSFGATSAAAVSEQAPAQPAPVLNLANAASTLVNISTLARLAKGDDVLVSGFVISGKTTRTVLVRAVGPTLAEFGLPDALSHPQLTVYKAGVVIATNNGWGDAADEVVRLTAAFDRSGAFRLADKRSRDAALFLTLGPGSYTLEVKSADGSAGAALVEVYDVP